MKRVVNVLATAGVVFAAAFAQAADISGKHANPNQEFGKEANYKLAGNAEFGRRTGTVGGDIDLNGHSFVMDTGGGNHTVLNGAITGRGSVEWRGGGARQGSPSALGGDQPNTFQGAFTLARGVLGLAKPAGVDAIPGNLIIGVKGDAVIQLEQSDQINDAAQVTLGGTGISGLALAGHHEKFASLALKTHGEIDLGSDPAALLVGDCSGCSWDLTKTLTIRGFKAGKDKLVFGKDDQGLSRAQLARIGFASPAGLPEGLYTAKIGPDGALAPGALIKAVNPPFDLSPAAQAARAKLYEVPGLARLTGKTSPLKDGLTIDFFGDSITWLNSYITAINKAIKSGAGTRDRRVKLINRGINGGGVLQVRDGSAKSAFPGSSAQKPFAEVIAGDKADLAVVFIGVNDVWWRKTSPEVFEKALRDVAASAKAGRTRLVLATLCVHGELPDGKNPQDPQLDQYAELTRKVAQDTGATLVDLRKAYIACLQNHNGQLRVDGTLYFKRSGVLTYDSVHPNSQGVTLLANLISEGLYEELAK